MVDARQHILSVLEEKGIISKFKSDLRKEVLNAMNKSLEKPEILANLESFEAQTCLELIYDFLEFAKLTNTLEIFTCEANIKKRPTKHDLEYKTSSKADPGKPVLYSLLDRSRKSISPEQSYEAPKSKFQGKIPVIPEIGLLPKKEIGNEGKVGLNRPEFSKPNDFSKPNEGFKAPEPVKPAEKPPSVLTALPKPIEKQSNMKLQPLTSLKKPVNLKGFDLVEDKPAKNAFDSDESIEEEIKESFDESFEGHKDLVESQATSSMGVDASVNSLALEDFDHVENVRAPRKK